MNSQNTTYQMALANCFVQAGQPTFALGIYKDVVNLDSNNVSALIELGKILLQQGSKVEAERIYLRLVQLDSLNAYYHSQLGYSQFKLNKKEDAIDSFNRSLEIDSLNSSTILQLSKIYFKDEEYKKAYHLLSRGLSANALNLPLNRLAAEVLFKLQKYRAAAFQYDLLVKFGDTTATVYQKLGFCNYFVAEQLIMSDSTESKKKIYEAIYALEESRRLNWDDPLTSLYLGICFKELKEYGRAITYLEESLNLLYPDYISDIYVHLGVAYEKQKKYPESIIAYQKGLEHKPSNDALLFQLATVYDEYYADREVPLMYYKLFVKRGGVENPILKNYAESRISALIEELHFSNGRSK
jgi:tetratricopeptide (TPR) repeat protein